MRQEEKDLLFKDLCARLPYHTRVKVWLKDGTTEEGTLDLEHNYGDVLRDTFYYNKIINIKPYLFPIHSMTEKQQTNLTKFIANGIKGENILYDWYNKNNFDYRRLIEKGLAIDATELNIY